MVLHQFNPDANILYLAAAVPAGLAVAVLCLFCYRLLMIVYGVYVGMLIGLVIEAGVSNAIDTTDAHQCTWLSNYYNSFRGFAFVLYLSFFFSLLFSLDFKRKCFSLCHSFVRSQRKEEKEKENL